MIKNISKTVLCMFIYILFSTFAYADKKTILTTIRPIHLILKEIAGEKLIVDYLLSQNLSVHNMTLRPSDVKKINKAARVFVVGDDLETSFVNALRKLNFMDRTIEIAHIKGIKLLRYRDKNFWLESTDHSEYEAHDDEHAHKDNEAHDDEHAHKDNEAHDDEHAHKDHEAHDDEHAHKDNEAHDCDEHAHKDHEAHDDEHAHKDHEAHDDHSHGYHDPHIWLSIENVRKIAFYAAKIFGEVDVKNKNFFQQRAKIFSKNLERTHKKIQTILKQVSNKGFFVSHDAYQYFEREYSLQLKGVVFVTENAPLSIKHVKTLQKIAQKENIQCVFYDYPSAKLNKMSRILKGKHNIDIVRVNPLLSDMPNITSYEGFMMHIARTMANCLAQ